MLIPKTDCAWCDRKLPPGDEGQYVGLEPSSEEMEERLEEWEGPTVPIHLAFAGKTVNAVIVKEGLDTKLVLLACSDDCANTLEENLKSDWNHLGSTN